MRILICLLLIVHTLQGNPFSYDLHVTKVPGKSDGVMIVAHGMGGTYRTMKGVPVKKTLIGFNFPDYDFGERPPEQTSYGTINELLPLLFVIKESVVVEGQDSIDLYGFSAGGAAVVNAIGVLNSGRYQSELEKIGISSSEKKAILEAIQNGVVILDAPLKSMDEVIAFQGPTPETAYIAERYRDNDMDPITSLKYLQGLRLHVILHFQQPDEVLSNRDDDLFYQRLKAVNAEGKTDLVIGTDNGHSLPHPSLWRFYNAL